MDDIKKFIHGFRKFQADYFNVTSEVAKPFMGTQKPGTLIIGCSDSRVDPAIMFGSYPGDIFVVRNVANLVPPYEVDSGHHGVSAALEFAVLILKVSNIIVLGHAKCGGIESLMCGSCGTGATGFIANWMKIVRKARDGVIADMAGEPPEARARACEQAAIVVSLENLMSFPWIKSNVEEGKLKIRGWYFDMGAGSLLEYSPETATFEAID